MTTDPADPRLGFGADPLSAAFRPPNQAYLVLPTAERQTLVRPLRRAYWHTVCGKVTTITAEAIAETYAADPGHYGTTYCSWCGQHRPVGAGGEFYWCDEDNIATQAPARQPKVGT